MHRHIPSIKEIERLAKMCFNKEKYRTDTIALEYGKAYSHLNGSVYRAYRCPNCRTWHLTTKA